jgi:hypothetical protein
MKYSEMANTERRLVLKCCHHKGLIPRALFLGEMRNIPPVSFEL